MKLFKSLLLIMSCSAIIVMSLPAACSNTSSSTGQKLSQQQVSAWREDIDYLKQALEQRHIHLYHRIDAEYFATELSRIKQQLPALNEAGLMIELMRAIKQVGDGHTQFSYWGGKYHSYPLHLQMFDEELRVIGIAQDYQHLLAAKLYAIEDIPIDQLRTLLTPVLQGVENIHSERQRFTETITVAEVLHGLAITKNSTQAKFTFELPNGEMQSVTFNSITPDQFQKQPMASINMITPSGFVQHKASIDGVELFLNSTDHIAYIDFHQYPQYPTMEKFSEALIEILRNANTHNVIIDLRNNSGGDFFVGLHLAWALIMIDNLHWRDGIYVLTGRKTFSAAMSNAVQYRQLLNATLVGEPTGANPVGYQDADSFSLPNSGWKVLYSKRLYRFQESADQGVQPDINIPLEWNNYRKGKDNQLAWVLDNIKNK